MGYITMSIESLSRKKPPWWEAWLVVWVFRTTGVHTLVKIKGGLPAPPPLGGGANVNLLLRQDFPGFGD